MPQNQDHSSNTYASLYISDPFLLGSKFFDQFEEIESYSSLSEGENASGLIMHTNQSIITMNFMPTDEIKQHLEGLSGFAHNFQTDSEKLLYTLARMRGVCFVIGNVIKDKPSAGGAGIFFLKKFNQSLNGMIFVADQLLDYDGEVLCEYIPERAERNPA
jgi:hypothetical protein